MLPYIHYLVGSGNENGLVTVQDLDENYTSYGSFYVPVDVNNNLYSQYILTVLKWKTKTFQEYFLKTQGNKIIFGDLISGAYFEVQKEIFKFEGLNRHPDHNNLFRHINFEGCNEAEDYLLDKYDVVFCGPQSFLPK